MRRGLIVALFVTAAQLGGATLAAGQPPAFQVQEIETGLGIGYAVRLLDLNGDDRLDIAVVDTNRVVWYENPSWKRHTLIEDQTKRDNVCFAPYDIDGDGHIDFALGADWRPADTVASGTLQWITRGPPGAQRWTVHPIGAEPTLHRIAWADIDDDGRAELLVVPLFGRGTSREGNYQQRPLRILAYKIPDDPVRGPWQPWVINEQLHVAHNFFPTDLDDDGRLDILVASYEGITLLQRQGPRGQLGTWTAARLHEGNQEDPHGSRGASEIKVGRLASGEKYIATIEPWHGHQVVVYRLDPPQVMRPQRWNRHVLDDRLKWGHAVWCANLDADADEELIIGVRDNRDDSTLCGVRLYDPQPDGTWKCTLLDPGGVAVEDLAAGDLDGDGRIDIVAVGRATRNIRIYWNRADRP
jgi:hypothetical protein